MEIFSQNLLNPEWWAKAIVVGLIAGYIKDWIPKIASGASAGMRRVRQKRIESDARLVARIRREPTLASVYGIKLLVDAGMGLFGLLLGATLPMIGHFYRTHPELDIGVATPETTALFKILSIAGLGVTLVCVFILPRAMDDFKLACATALKTPRDGEECHR